MTETVAAGDAFGLCGAVLAERFRVDSVVAEGGFGVVYRGAQLALDRPVAIKVLKTPPQLSPAEAIQFRERFAAEGKIIARLKHPNIVDVYDFGVAVLPGRYGTASVPWMALEWLDGCTLEADIEGRRAAGRPGRAPADVLAMMRPVLSAFAAAHRQGIVHRDIKPGNIMLANEGAATLVPKVLDFGISKIGSNDSAQPTRTSGMPAFSPAYAAPEQVTFDRTGVWTDIHAIGLVLTELLTGYPPYGAEGMHVFEQVMLARRPTPATFGVNVGAWEPVLQRALALPPGARWTSVDELLAALTAGLDARRDRLGPRVATTMPAPVRAGETMRLPPEAADAFEPAPSSGARALANARTAPAVTERTAASRKPRVAIAFVLALVAAAGLAAALRLLFAERPETVEAQRPVPTPPASKLTDRDARGVEKPGTTPETLAPPSGEPLARPETGETHAAGPATESPEAPTEPTPSRPAGKNGPKPHGPGATKPRGPKAGPGRAPEGKSPLLHPLPIEIE